MSDDINPADDPVARRDDDDERQVLELAQLDHQLDEEQRRLDAWMDRDPLRVIWFGVPDGSPPEH